MEHEYTISGRIFPERNQVSDETRIEKFAMKINWAEEDFSEFGIRISAAPEGFLTFTMKSEDIAAEQLKGACMNLSVIFGCTVALCKDHEVYGVANVFNGGSDYEVVDEDCDLWVYKNGSQETCEHTKEWNEKFSRLERKFTCPKSN